MEGRTGAEKKGGMGRGGEIEEGRRMEEDRDGEARE